jgi:conjugal transfer pilus assembly protein TraI
MKRTLLDWFKPKPIKPPEGASQRAPGQKVVVQVVAPGDQTADGLPVYPPVDSGILVRGAGEILATQHELLNRLKKHVSLEQSQFEKLYAKPVRRVAHLIGLLPATRDRHHSGAGGLFRLSLQMGYFAARSAGGKLFAPEAGPEAKRAAEAAWQHAAFLTALASELYKPISDMQVVTASGATWSPFMGSLTDWARAQGSDKVFVRWVSHAAGDAPGGRGTAGWALNEIVGNELMAELHAVDPKIVTTMVAVVTGTLGALSDHPLVKVINTARRSCIEADEAIQPMLYGKLTQGSHLEPILLDGMRTLIESKAWAVNESGSALHWGSDGLFLTWPIAAKQLHAELTLREVQGVPANPTTLAEILHSSGVVATARDGTPWHVIFTGESADKCKEVVALRMVRPESLFPPSDTPPPNPLPRPLLDDFRKKSTAATGSADRPAPNATAAPAPAPAPAPSSTPASTPTLAAGFTPPPRATGPVDGQAAPASATAVTADATEQAIAKSSLKPEESPQTLEASPSDAPSEASTTQSKAKAGESPQKSGGGGLPPGIPADVVSLLGTPLCRELVRWRDAFNQGRAPNSFKVVEAGLAIVQSYIVEGCALEIVKVQEPLKANGMLEMRMQGDKSRPVHVLEFGDKTERAYVLKRDFAKRIGFVLPAVS